MAAFHATAQYGGGVSDTNAVLQPANLPQPAPGVPFTDPMFGTTLARISDASSSGGMETHSYSQLQAFSPGNTYVLLESDLGFIVRSVDNLGLVRVLPDINCPRWHPTLPASIVHFDSNSDDSLRLQITDVVTGATTTIANFTDYRVVYVNPSFDELSRDGRWVAGMALRRSDTERVIFAFDMVSRQFGAELALGDLYASPCSPHPVWGIIEPDWVAPSPNGDYLVIQWPADGTGPCNGMETFAINTGAFTGRVNDGHQHGDLGIAADGRQYYMTFEIYHPSGIAAIAVRWLPGNNVVSPPQYLSLDPGWLGGHISCQGPPGSPCLVTNSSDLNGQPGSQWPLEGELFLQYLDSSRLRLAHHRSSECGYWTQPRASLSADGKLAIFASDWGVNPCGNSWLGNPDPYILHIPDSAITVATCEAPANVTTGRITPASARLQWSARPEATGYVIRGKRLNSASWIALPIASGSLAHKDVNGLANGATYVWQIKTQCSGSRESAWSEPDTFTMGCLMPSTHWANPVTATGALLQWTPVFGAAGYEIRGKVAGSSNEVQLLINGGATGQRAVYGLQPNTAYQWKIRTICRPQPFLAAPFTDWATFTTAANKTGAIAGEESKGMDYDCSGLLLHPNPAGKWVNLRWPEGERLETPMTLGLADVHGKTISAWKRFPAGSATQRLDVSGLPNGIYQLAVESEGQRCTSRLVIAR